ncbi:hypothetical protein GOODEAATRI_030275, partial [Goodea atripinnis]
VQPLRGCAGSPPACLCTASPLKCSISDVLIGTLENILYFFNGMRNCIFFPPSSVMGLGDVSRLAERNESEISLFNTVASTRGLARALITREDDEIFIKLSGWCECISS